MAKQRSVFVCRDCGAQVPRWQGQCPGCDAWNTLEQSATAAGAPVRRGGYAGEAPRLLGEIGQDDREDRILIGVAELDRVLGGGHGGGFRRAVGRRSRHRKIDPAAAGGGPAGRARCRRST